MKSLRLTITFLSLVCAGSSLVASALAADMPKSQEGAKTSVPRLTDGKPDFSGVWVRGGMGGGTFGLGQRTADGSVCILCPPEPKPGATAQPALPRMMPDHPKYKPEFAAKVKMLDEKQVELDPALRCGNPGLPRIGAPDQIVQTPGQIVFLYNDLSGAAYRVIPTDGRPHRTDAEETYLGDSVGKWDGDTLEIEAVKFVEDTWLIDNGAFHTPDLKVVERLQFNGDKLEYQATAYDPGVLAEPWKMRKRVLSRTNKPMSEPLPCIESDIDHVVDGTHHDNAR